MNNQANIFYNFEQQNHYVTKVFHCKICRDQYHISYFCKNGKNKIELFCKLCNHRGHSVDKCTFN